MLVEDQLESQKRKERDEFLEMAKKRQRDIFRLRSHPQPITERQAKCIKTLYEGVTFFPGSLDKRFVKQVRLITNITYGQALYLARLVYRYRRQLGLNDESAARVRDELNQDAEAIKQDKNTFIFRAV